MTAAMAAMLAQMLPEQFAKAVGTADNYAAGTIKKLGVNRQTARNMEKLSKILGGAGIDMGKTSGELGEITNVGRSKQDELYKLATTGMEMPGDTNRTIYTTSSDNPNRVMKKMESIPAGSVVPSVSDIISNPELKASSLVDPVTGTNLEGSGLGEASKLDQFGNILSGVSAVGQIGAGIYSEVMNNKNQPSDKAPAFLKKMYNDAQERAEIGLTMTERNRAKQAIENNKRALINSGVDSSMGSTGTSFNRVLSAASMENEANIQLIAENDRIKREKVKEAESTGFQLANVLAGIDARNYANASAKSQAAGALVGSGVKTGMDAVDSAQSKEFYAKLLSSIG